MSELGIQVATPPTSGQGTGPETESAIRADHAWGRFMHTLARTAPQHVLGIRAGGQAFRRLQKPMQRGR